MSKMLLGTSYILHTYCKEPENCLMHTYNKQKVLNLMIDFLPLLEEEIRSFRVQTEDAFSIKAT